MVKLFIDFNNGLGEQSLDSLLPQFEVLSFLPEAPNINRETITIPRRHGLILPQHPRDVTYGERKIDVEIYLNALKHENFYMYRHQLYALLVKPFPYYISSDLWPNRRFLVTCDGNFSIQKKRRKPITISLLSSLILQGWRNQLLQQKISSISLEQSGLLV